MVGRNNSAETVVLASSSGIARVSLALYLVAFVVVPAFYLPFNLSFVVSVFVAAAIGVGGYVRFRSMRLVVGDENVTVVNMLNQHSLDTATARIVAKDENGFWAEGELQQGRASVLTLTDASDQQVMVGVAPTFGDRHRSVIEDFNIALARHRLAS